MPSNDSSLYKETRHWWLFKNVMQQSISVKICYKIKKIWMFGLWDMVQNMSHLQQPCTREIFSHQQHVSKKEYKWSVVACGLLMVLGAPTMHVLCGILTPDWSWTPILWHRLLLYFWPLLFCFQEMCFPRLLVGSVSRCGSATSPTIIHTDSHSADSSHHSNELWPS